MSRVAEMHSTGVRTLVAALTLQLDGYGDELAVFVSELTGDEQFCALLSALTLLHATLPTHALVTGQPVGELLQAWALTVETNP